MNGHYYIDPDGVNDHLPFKVFCNMSADVAETLIGHDAERETLVDGYAAPRDYIVSITYELRMSDIKRLIDVSTSCRQFIQWKCFASPFNGNRRNHVWRSRDGVAMTNWGEAPPGKTSCPCAVTGSCDNNSYVCNCDMNDPVWRSDEGFLTDKATLPVTRMEFGDTGTYLAVNKMGNYTLGKLVCFN